MSVEHVVDLGVRLFAAAVIGGAIGLNRDLHGKPAGLRMLGFVSLGSAVATLALVNFDPSHGMPVDGLSRVIQGVLTGVGFLGAGVIMRDEAGKPHRLNTAASIWVTAALGIACALGAWVAVALTTVLTFGLLTIGSRIDHIFFGRFEKTQDPKD
ncbi:MAG: MgtC/SapB family protein [Alphaproteobacteria bacterium]|nr:MgtC/SapB family protein [Alphaproteobacteria bacterium]